MHTYPCRICSYLIALFVLLAGCNGDMSPLKGRVTFSDDGMPVKMGRIVFQNEHHSANGKIDESGYYTVGSLKDSDGLPPGEYNIILQGVVESLGNDAYGHSLEITLIDPKYSQRDQSGLSFVVAPGKNTFDVVVDRISERDKKRLLNEIEDRKISAEKEKRANDISARKQAGVQK